MSEIVNARQVPKKPRVAVGLGEVLWDLLPAGKQLGGAPANFAFHAQQLGATGVVVSAVGRDALGEEILRRMPAMVDRWLLHVDLSHATGTVGVTLDAAGVPTYTIHAPVAWDFLPDDVSPRFAAEVDVVCFGSLAQRSPTSRAAIRRFLSLTRPDCLRVFDINLRQKFYDADTVVGSLERASILKLNDQELPVVADLLGMPSDEAGFAAALFGRFPSLSVIALTRGPHGSALFTRDATSDHPGLPTTLADTIGAGDAFTATLAIGLLRNVPLDGINETANRVAAYVCSQHGATPKLPKELATSLWERDAPSFDSKS